MLICAATKRYRSMGLRAHTLLAAQRRMVQRRAGHRSSCGLALCCLQCVRAMRAVLLALRDGAVVGRAPLLQFGPPGDVHEEQVSAVQMHPGLGRRVLPPSSAQGLDQA